MLGLVSLRPVAVVLLVSSAAFALNFPTTRLGIPYLHISSIMPLLHLHRDHVFCTLEVTYWLYFFSVSFARQRRNLVVV